MLLYRVVQNFDPYDVDGGNLVITAGDYTIVYNAQPGMGNTTTLCIAISISGTWLVGAEPLVMVKLPTPRMALQAYLNTHASWGIWKVDGDNDEEFENVVEYVDLPEDVSKSNPKDLGNGRYAVGGKATTKYQLGPFVPAEIEVDTNWRGDYIAKKITAVDVEVTSESGIDGNS